MRQRSNEEDTVHLEYEEHPGDAEADEGAPNKEAIPDQEKLQDCSQKGRWESKGFEA